jgi:hypothetical protein
MDGKGLDEPDVRLGPAAGQQEAGDLTAELGDAAQLGSEIVRAEVLLAVRLKRCRVVVRSAREARVVERVQGDGVLFDVECAQSHAVHGRIRVIAEILERGSHPPVAARQLVPCRLQQRLAALVAGADPLVVLRATELALAFFRPPQDDRSDPLALVLGSDGGDGYRAVHDRARDDPPIELDYS